MFEDFIGQSIQREDIVVVLYTDALTSTFLLAKVNKLDYSATPTTKEITIEKHVIVDILSENKTLKVSPESCVVVTGLLLEREYYPNV